MSLSFDGLVMDWRLSLVRFFPYIWRSLVLISLSVPILITWLSSPIDRVILLWQCVPNLGWYCHCGVNVTNCWEVLSLGKMEVKLWTIRHGDSFSLIVIPNGDYWSWNLLSLSSICIHTWMTLSIEGLWISCRILIWLSSGLVCPDSGSCPSGFA